MTNSLESETISDPIYVINKRLVLINLILL